MVVTCLGVISAASWILSISGHRALVLRSGRALRRADEKGALLPLPWSCASRVFSSSAWGSL
jgi:hypothetical protein